MARKRMIDPSIWTDEGMEQLTPRQQLLYVGMICNADDDGRLKGSAAAVRMMLPTVYTLVRAEEVESDILCVARAMTKTCRYWHDGNQYIALLSFRRWQQIQRPTKSKLPPPPDAPPHAGHGTPDTQPAVRDRGSLIDHSMSDPREGKGREGKEEKGKEGKGREGDHAPPPARPPDPALPWWMSSTTEDTPIPDDFALNDTMREWAGEHISGVDIEHQTEILMARAVDERWTSKNWFGRWKRWMLHPIAARDTQARASPNGHGAGGATSPNGDNHAGNSRGYRNGGRQSGGQNRRRAVGAPGSLGPGGYDSWADDG